MTSADGDSERRGLVMRQAHYDEDLLPYIQAKSVSLTKGTYRPMPPLKGDKSNVFFCFWGRGDLPIQWSVRTFIEVIG